MTGLGSNLTFVQQTACLKDRGQIEIIRQNFGFDFENGINEVELDVTYKNPGKEEMGVYFIKGNIGKYVMKINFSQMA